jgi:hypothetical protein
MPMQNDEPAMANGALDLGRAPHLQRRAPPAFFWYWVLRNHQKALALTIPEFGRKVKNCALDHI